MHDAALRQVRSHYDTLDTVTQTIDRTFDDPADRMMLKLYLDQYGIDEVARFSGEPVEQVRRRVASCLETLEQRLGCLAGSIQTSCVQVNVAMHYRPV